MLRHRLYTLLLSAAIASASLCGAAGLPSWEPVKTEVAGAKSVVKDTDLEILTAPSCIIVTCGRPMEIKVFTILGRVVSSETLQPGTSRLTVGAHGVYIVKVGELTCKIAL